MNGSVNKIKILVAEDDDDDLFIFKDVVHECREDFEAKVDHVATMQDVLSEVDNNEFDIIFLDYRLGESNGLEILKTLREKKYVFPIILLTGQGDQNLAVDAMKAGATDYIVKANLSAQTLSTAIRSALRLFQQQTKRERAEKALRAQSKLLEGVSLAATRLLTVHDHQNAVEEALGILGLAAEINSVFICQEQIDSQTEEPAFLLRYIWDDNAFSHNMKSGSVVFSTNDPRVRIWREGLIDGESFNGPIDKLPSPVAEYFNSLDLCSVMLKPLFIDYNFWGFIVFGDGSRNRSWTKDEEAIFITGVASLEGEIKRYRDNQAFRSIVEGTSSRTGDDFFKSLVRNLASALPVRNAYLCELPDYSISDCRVIAGWEKSEFREDANLNIVESPCEELVNGLVSFYSHEVKKKFPNIDNLLGMKVQSFAGVPFFDSASKPAGFLAVADDKPILDKDRTISIMRVFASRAGAELERKRSEEIIKNMAYYDSLTGLPNRVLLSDRSEMILAQAKRNNSMFGVFFLDFDRFKPINDSFGHAIGDMLLKEVAKKLPSVVREGDTVARLGGDEFIFLLPELRCQEDALIIARKLNEMGRRPIKLEDHNIKISFSIGISIYPIDGKNLNELMKNADDALYSAKKKGGDTFHLYSQLPVKGA